MPDPRGLIRGVSRNRRVITGFLLALVVIFARTESASSTPDTWTIVASMAGIRYFNTATLLPGGEVLVAGGAKAGSAGTPQNFLATTERYNDALDTWTPAASMSAARYAPSAVLLSNGNVLVTGGLGPLSAQLTTAEIYDPVANTWSAAASMGTGRHFHTSTLLPDGRVFVVGGFQATAEIYDPTANSWTAAPNMTVPRGQHTATLLPNGKVLVAGGDQPNPSPPSTAEIYDPVSNTWQLTGSMTVSRITHSAQLLPNGKVLVAGGRSGSTPLTTTELYDPSTNVWTAAATMATVRIYAVTVPLLNGHILVVGAYDGSGTTLSNTEEYDPAANAWSPASSMNIDRRFLTATVLQDGRVLAAGGVATAGGQSTAEIYEPNPCPMSGDADCDGFHDPQQALHAGPSNADYLLDNCPVDYNPAQLNADANFIDNSPPYASTVDDKTWVNSDAMGDACDTDDDNDGLTDAAELSGVGCGNVVSNPVLRDTDGDRFLDGPECALSFSPANPLSHPLLSVCAAAGDSDGDKAQNRNEVCFFNSNPNAVDTDADLALNGAKDGCEVMSLNADRVVNSIDQAMLGQGISGSAGYTVNVDINKDGTLNSIDQGLMASFIVPTGQCP